MEKKQYDLCLEILRRFNRERLLANLVLIGSWCVVFYKDYFLPNQNIDDSALRTRDIDFLLPSPSKILHPVDVPSIVKDLGFVSTIGGSRGIIRLSHPELILEFLVPERGRGQDKPVALPQLGMNAVALRFLNFLTENIIPVKVEDFYVRVPHPINFALHKLIVSGRRTNADKSQKDQRMAVDLLNALINKGDHRAIQRIFRATPAKWRREMKASLGSGHEKILDLLH